MTAPSPGPERDPAASVRRMPSRMVLGVFAAIFAVLAGAYYFVLQPGYAPLFTQMRASDAATIVAQLDAKGVPRRLADDGTTVLVPGNRLDDARVIIAGSDVSAKGAVGFELFNKSDMGLTDFAQKINYQRALQGELERTIMMMDGIERARVHLAIPERTLFRTDKSVPKAAVELVPATGHTLSDARVEGIQRLVASAVPDLMAPDVAVLDDGGRVLSAVDGEAAADMVSPAAEQRQAVESYYRARARAAALQAMPGERIDVQVEARPLVTGKIDIADAAAPADPGAQPRRDFALHITLVTASPLASNDAEALRAAVTTATALDSSIGDLLLFRVSSSTGGIGKATVSQAAASRLPPVVAAQKPWLNDIAWAGLLVGLIVAAWLATRRRNGTVTMSAADRDAFIARLRTALRGANGHVAS